MYEEDATIGRLIRNLVESDIAYIEILAGGGVRVQIMIGEGDNFDFHETIDEEDILAGLTEACRIVNNILRMEKEDEEDGYV